MPNQIDYKSIYKQNNFTVCDFSFTIDTLKDTPLYKKSFTIITAYNPQNRLLTNEENIKKDQQLHDELKHKKYNFEDALGFLGDHKEKSYCIYEIAFESAIRLAKKYDQYSIFYHSKEQSGYFKVSDNQISKIL